MAATYAELVTEWQEVERPMKKIVIGGTGRAGTSFLFRMFHDLGFSATSQAISNSEGYDSFVSAGFDEPIGNAFRMLPSKDIEVLKSPFLFELVEADVFNNDNVGIVLIPVRDAYVAAMSRCANEIVHVLKQGDALRAMCGSGGKYRAGVHYSTSLTSQVEFSAIALSYLIYHCARKKIPMVIVAFPDLADDCEVLVEALKPFLREKSLPPSCVKEWIDAHFDSARLSVTSWGPDAANSTKDDHVLFEKLNEFLGSREALSGDVFCIALSKFLEAERREKVFLLNELESLRKGYFNRLMSYMKKWFLKLLPS